MNHLTGSIVGKITQRFALTLTDQPNHVMSMGEVHGPRDLPIRCGTTLRSPTGA